MNIRSAEISESSWVISFYHSLIDAMQEAEYGPGWEKEIYPTSDFIRESIKNRELFIAEHGEEIAAVMVINHECNESYHNYEWKHTADKEEISVIHALGVHPKFSGQGIGKALVAEAIRICKEHQQKVIRLDVLKGNLPAEKLYRGMGFEYLATLPMFYEDTGWTDYELYEYVIR